MFLKSIEVQGFKSFANKIVFEFNGGITGIVGPNGSGKSNVADAVRWVLGEQSAKQLRGASMQDVIFSGTQNRKPQGYAYVSLTMDNSDHYLPIEYDEVTVSRRVYRSGESEYLLNGSPCRLRDVNELFYDTGIGKEGYSIIGQGQIDKILSGKPEDRRELFDEAAGIVKFKKRKTVAQKKLESERQNLIRVTDILTELSRQVGPLEEQSKKAREYLKLRDALKELELMGFKLETKAQRERLAETERRIRIVSGDLDERRGQAAQLKSQYEELSARLSALEAALEETRGQLSENTLSAESMEGQIRVLEEQIHTEQVHEEHLKERMASIETELSQREKEREGFMARKGELNQALDELDDKQSALGSSVKEQEEKIRLIEADAAARRSGILEALKDKASLGARGQRLETLKEQNQVRKSELSQRLLKVKSEEELQELSVSRFKEQLLEKKEELEGLQKKRAEADGRCRSAQEAVYRENRSLNVKQQEYHTLRTRLESLRNLAERYDGYGNSIRRVMEARSRVPGIIGVVADLLETPKEYETAVETALGGSIQNIVTDSESTAKNLIGYLKKNKFGRATFLPLTSITARGGFQKKEALKEPGVVGLAHTLVKVKGGYSHLAEYLLGRILVVDQIDHAIAIAKKYQYSLRIVTLEGELLSAGGSMTGGAFKNSSNLLGRKRELEELERAMTAALSQYDQIQLRVKEAEDELKAGREELEAIREQIQKAQVDQSTLEANYRAAEEKAEEIRSGYEEIGKEGKRLAEELEKLEEAKAALSVESESLEKKNRDEESKAGQLEKTALEMKEQLEGLKAELSRVQVEFSTLSQKDSFLLENILRIGKEKERLLTEQESLKEGILESRGKEAEKKEQILSVRRRIQELSQAAGELKRAIEDRSREKEECQSRQKGFFDRQEEVSAEIARLDKELYRLEGQKARSEEAMEQQAQHIWEEYELTPSEAEAVSVPEDASLPALKKQAGSLRQSIKELGPVNVGAIEEYKEVSERYFFMKGQHEDLEKAEKTLLDVIEELDAGMRRQFEEKFKDIKEEFDKVFKELFGGGQGALELVEGEDLLEAGVQIIAQPPGKKLQNMMQLSGGEKALTAICLLFAIQNLKPSPFCLLDEIEAALDDSNVGRFAGYLDKLKAHTQFIVITHRRGTMLAADRLYGITMQEKGVSTLVSVDLAEASA